MIPPGKNSLSNKEKSERRSYMKECGRVIIIEIIFQKAEG